jgi:hypothetical protein
MPTWLRAGLVQTAILGAVGLLIGAVGAWVGLLSADGATSVAGAAAQLYPALAVALPVALLVMNRAKPAAGTPLVAGALGAVLAHFCFIVACTNLPATFGGEDPVAMSQALPAAIGWIRPGVVLVASLISAGILAARPA